MNLDKELDRITQPSFGATKARQLPLEEIESLQKAGQITPPSKIPQAHGCPRESVPTRWGRGKFYGYSRRGIRWR